MSEKTKTKKNKKNIRKIIVNPKKQKDLTFYGCNNVCYVFQSYTVKSAAFMSSIQTNGDKSLIMHD